MPYVLIICFSAIILAAEYVVLIRYLKVKKTKRFYVCFGIGCLLSAAVGVLLQLRHANAAYNYVILIFLGILKCLGTEDLGKMRLDSIMIYVLIAVGIIISFIVPDSIFWKIIPVSAVITGVLILFSVISKDAVGKGDALCVGASTLCFPFGTAFSMIIYTFVFCLIYGIIMVCAKRLTIKQSIPFVPFLIIGMTAALITG